MTPIKHQAFIATMTAFIIIFAATLAWWITIMIRNFTAINAPLDTAPQAIERIDQKAIDRIFKEPQNGRS